jgi:hypothetical protein
MDGRRGESDRMAHVDEWSDYAPADALLVGTWELESGNRISVRGRQRSNGAVDIWIRWASAPSAANRWEYSTDVVDDIHLQARAAFEQVAGVLTCKEENGPAQ